MKNSMQTLTVTGFLILVAGCSLTESEVGPQADIVILSVAPLSTDYGPVAVQLPVTNIGAATASGVLVRSYPVKSGQDLTNGVVTYFNPDSTIAPGDSAYGQAVLWGISSHAEYDTLRYFILWTTTE